MGIGQGSGETRAVDAVKYAMESPLLEVSIQGAKGVLINFTGGRDMGMHEIEEAAKLIHDSVDPEANIIWGTVLDENLTGEIRVTLVATGFDADRGNQNLFMQPDTSRSTSTYIDDEVEEEATDATLPFLTPQEDKPVFEGGDKPLVQARPETTENNEVEDEEEIGFDFDGIEYDDDATVEPKQDAQPTEPIVETAGDGFEGDMNDFDKPSFLRKHLKIGKSKPKSDDDMPSFVKKKL